MQLHDHSLTSSFLHARTHMADPYLNRAPQSGRLTSQQWKESEWPIKLAGKTRGKFVTCCVIWISSLRNSGSSSYPPPFPVSKKRKERKKAIKNKNSLEHTSVSLTAGMWTAEMVNFSRLRRHNHHTNVLGFATGPSGAQLPSTDIRSHIFSRQNFLFKRTFPSYSKVVLRKILLCRKNINKKK